MQQCSVFNEFEVTVTPTVVEKLMTSGKTCCVPKLAVTAKHVQSGKVLTMDLPAYADVEHNLTVEVLKAFPDSATAAYHRCQHKMFSVQVPPERLDDLGELMHTALRKLCDSKATSLWWNLLHELPGFVCLKLYEKTAEVLKSNEVVRLDKLIAEVQQTWKKVLDDAYQYYRRIELNKGAYYALPGEFHYPDWPLESAFDLSNREVAMGLATCKTAALSLSFLTAEDWEGALGYVIEYLPADKKD